MDTFRPFRFFGPPQVPLANLQRRVEYQKRALEQAEADLAEARGERAIAEIDDLGELGRQHTPRTLSPEASAAAAALIIAAGRKARGLDRRAFEPGPPQPSPEAIDPERVAAQILAAVKKANLGRK